MPFFQFVSRGSDGTQSGTSSRMASFLIPSPARRTRAGGRSASRSGAPRRLVEMAVGYGDCAIRLDGRRPRTAIGCRLHLAAVFVREGDARRFVPSARVLHTMPSRSLVLVTINIEEGVPGRGSGPPATLRLRREGIPALCRRPGHSSGGRNGHSKRTSAQITLRVYAIYAMASRRAERFSYCKGRRRR